MERSAARFGRYRIEGECSRAGQTRLLLGIQTQIGARVAGEAGAGQVVASGTVRDLVAGSGIEFDDLGASTLKSVPRGMAAVRGARRGRGIARVVLTSRDIPERWPQPTLATLDVRNRRISAVTSGEGHLPGPHPVAQIRRGNRPRLRSMIRNGPAATRR